MPTTIHSPPSTVDPRNVLALTVLCFLAVASWIASVTMGAPFAIRRYPGVAIEVADFPMQALALVAAQSSFFAFCAFLARRQARPVAAMRYGVQLQIQSALEIASLFPLIVLCALGLYGLAVVTDDTDTQTSMREMVASGRGELALIAFALAIPGMTVIVASLRLHVLSRRPGALAGMIDGSLPRRDIVVHGDLATGQSELVRHLERLTSADMPGLGRVIYGSHAKLATRKDAHLRIHELTWWTCPMKMNIVLVPLDNGLLELRLRCRLRAGWYRWYVFPTPADVVAEMQYVDVHLAQPFVAGLERVSAQRRHEALRDQAAEAQLRILQAQIEPHFLFNTLANLRQLYRTSHDDGEAMLDHLITYLRCTMHDLRAESSTVAREMDVAVHYLAIMRIRMGERLAYRFSVSDALMTQPMPPAMLISLVENAIKHGLSGVNRGEIVLSATSNGTSLRVSVADDGAGISTVGGTGVGLSNIRQRLEAIHGDRAWLEVGVPAQGGFVATIVIPLEQRK